MIVQLVLLTVDKIQISFKEKMNFQFCVKREISWTHYWKNAVAGILPIFRGAISFTSHWSQILWALAVDLSLDDHLI